MGQVTQIWFSCSSQVNMPISVNFAHFCFTEVLNYPPHTFCISTVLKSNIPNMKHCSNHFENICFLLLGKAHFVHRVLHSAIVRCVIKIWVFDGTLFQVLWDRRKKERKIFTWRAWWKNWCNVSSIILHMQATCMLLFHVQMTVFQIFLSVYFSINQYNVQEIL